MIKSSCTRHGAIIPGQRNAHRRAARHWSKVGVDAEFPLKWIQIPPLRSGTIFFWPENAPPECGWSGHGSKISIKTNTNSSVALWKKFSGARHGYPGERLEWTWFQDFHQNKYKFVRCALEKTFWAPDIATRRRLCLTRLPLASESLRLGRFQSQDFAPKWIVL